MLVKLILIALVILISPFIRFFIKRFFFYVSLKHACKKSGAKCFGNKVFWIFSMKKSPNCDFYVETDENVYSVKLSECVVKRAEMTFVNSDTYSIKNYRWCIVPYMWLSVKPKEHHLPKYNFEYNIKDEFLTKTIIPVVLILPLPVFLTYKNGSAKLELGNGTVISGEFAIYSGKGFLREIQR